jgi:hypothetical protein
MAVECYIIEDDVYRRCEHCNRLFSLLDEIDREEYFYGHECKTTECLNTTTKEVVI